VTAIGVVTLTIRAALPAGPRQLFLPVAFAGGALAFFFLYQTWIRDLVSGPVAAGSRLDDEVRRRTIRRVLGLEMLLTTNCVVAANLLLNLDWNRDVALGAAVSLIAAVISIVGCAFALSSGLARRSYADAGR
jgi:hypothetical protein